jgi:hypothetical protein
MTLAKMLAKQMVLESAMADLAQAETAWQLARTRLIAGAQGQGPDWSDEYAEAVDDLADRAAAMVTVWKEAHDV